MKKSEAAISYVCFGKAADLEIDPILFSSTIHYILHHPKPWYDENDIVPAINLFLDVVRQQVKVASATMKPIFSGLNEQDFVSAAILRFREKHGTDNFVDYIFTNCKNELRAVIDYNEMTDTGFREQDILKTIEHYA
jgi:hypothetical protein